MSIISGVYKITYITDGRIYIGSAANIIHRWRWHRNSQAQLIGKMIKKHGKESFSFEVIEEVEPIKEKLEQREQYYLDLLQPFPWNNNNGFNLSPKAYTCLGIKRSEETKQKMREAWKNRSPEYFEKQKTNAKRGDENPAKRPEVREKISKAMLGKTWKNDPIRMAKHIASHKGKTHTEEAKKNMKAAQQKNKTRSTEAREKFYLAQRVLYEIIKPNGETFKMYSRELKIYCKEKNLSYSNLISAREKPYKGGWKTKIL